MAGGAATLSLTGCGSRIQSPLDPAGIQAARISTLWWLMFVVIVTVFILVLVFVGIAMARAPRLSRPGAPRIAPAQDERTWRGVTAAIAASVVALFAILIASVVTGARVGSLPSKGAIAIDVIGHQWWWEFRFPNMHGDQAVTTANEIHIPVGVPLVVRTTSADVIHSFWVPHLGGKRDVLPGRVNRFELRADRPGVFRGQCTEFCGLQHAHQALYVIAEPRARFDAWLEGQRMPAAEPVTDSQRRGREVFLTSRCASCHTIRGTSAGGRKGPDLTHLASRHFIAAGTLPNTRGNLTGWIVDPQGVKPGSRMPPNPLPQPDLTALVDYLESLR